jgi:hypothetical protein
MYINKYWHVPLNAYKDFDDLIAVKYKKRPLPPGGK